MAPHSSTPAWKIPWTEEPGRLQSMESGRVRHDWVTSFTFHFDALEKEMATHSHVLAWRISGTGEPGGLPSMGSHRVGHDWSNLAAAAEVGRLTVSLASLRISPILFLIVAYPGLLGLAVIIYLSQMGFLFCLWPLPAFTADFLGKQIPSSPDFCGETGPRSHLSSADMSPVPEENISLRVILAQTKTRLQPLISPCINSYWHCLILSHHKFYKGRETLEAKTGGAERWHSTCTAELLQGPNVPQLA